MFRWMCWWKLKLQVVETQRKSSEIHPEWVLYTLPGQKRKLSFCHLVVRCNQTKWPMCNCQLSSTDSELFSTTIASLGFGWMPFQVYLYPWKTNKYQEPQQTESIVGEMPILWQKNDDKTGTWEHFLGHASRTIIVIPKNIRAWLRRVPITMDGSSNPA